MPGGRAAHAPRTWDKGGYWARMPGRKEVLPQPKEMYIVLVKKLEMAVALGTKHHRTSWLFAKHKKASYAIVADMILEKPITDMDMHKAIDGRSKEHKAAELLGKAAYGDVPKTLDAFPRAEVSSHGDEIKGLYLKAREGEGEIKMDGEGGHQRPRKEWKNIAISESEVVKVIEAIAKKGSAPGPGGITAGQLQKWCENRSFRTAITWYVRDVINGMLPADNPLAELNRAKGLPILKPNGKIRPIGINETLLNVAASVLLDKLPKKILAQLDEHQDRGYGRAGGSESIIRALCAIRRRCERVKSPVIIMTIDFRNAFNSVFWDKMFALMHKKVPELIPFMIARYKDMVVVFKDKTGALNLKMERGVSQGCPLSPPIFQLVMNEILSEVRESMKGSLFYAYLDDCTIVAHSMRDAIAAYVKIRRTALEYGLEVNEDKCELFVPSFCSKLNVCSSVKISWKMVGAKNAGEFNEVMSDIGKFKRQHSGIELLGSCVGNEAFVDAWTKKEFDKVADTIARDRLLFAFINGPSYAKGDTNFNARMLKYVRYCSSARHTYLMRVLPTRVTSKYATIIDSALARTVLEIARPDAGHGVRSNPAEQDKNKGWVESDDVLAMRELLEEGNIDFDTTWGSDSDDEVRRVLARLSIERITLGRGGLGLNSVRHQNVGARLGSDALTGPTMAHAFRTFFKRGTRVTLRDIDGVKDYEHTNRMRSEYNENNKVNGNTLDEIKFNPEVSSGKAQHAVNWDMKNLILPELMRVKLVAIEAKLSEEEFKRRQLVARWTSTSSPESNAWLHSSDLQITAALTDVVTSDNLLKMIGSAPPGPKICPKCLNNISSDRFGHAIGSGCHRSGVAIAGKNVKEHMRFACGALGLNPSTTEPFLADCGGFRLKADRPPERIQRADFKTYHGGESTLFDSSHTAKSPAERHRSGERGLEASRTEDLKFSAYRAKYDFRDGAFVPVVVDVFGAWGRATRKFFSTQNDLRKKQKLGSAWGKIKAFISIGACLAYTARVHSVREYFRDDAKAQAIAAPEVNAPEEMVSQPTNSGAFTRGMGKKKAQPVLRR